MKDICRSAIRYAAENGITIRERTDAERRERMPACPYLLVIDMFTHWEFPWDGKYKTMRECHRLTLTW